MTIFSLFVFLPYLYLFPSSEEYLPRWKAPGFPLLLFFLWQLLPPLLAPLVSCHQGPGLPAAVQQHQERRKMREEYQRTFGVA